MSNAKILHPEWVSEDLLEKLENNEDVEGSQVLAEILNNSRTGWAKGTGHDKGQPFGSFSSTPSFSRFIE
jgi:hypothetical protein